MRHGDSSALTTPEERTAATAAMHGSSSRARKSIMPWSVPVLIPDRRETVPIGTISA